jgi:hypothetical protein
VIGQLGSLLSTRQHRREVLTLKQDHVGKTGLPSTVVRGQFHGYRTHRDQIQGLRGIAEGVFMPVGTRTQRFV